MQNYTKQSSNSCTKKLGLLKSNQFMVEYTQPLVY